LFIINNEDRGHNTEKRGNQKKTEKRTQNCGENTEQGTSTQKNEIEEEDFRRKGAAS